MKLVNSREEIDKDRPYQENYNLAKSVYPKRYPAFIDFENHDGGMGGDYWSLKVLEIPKGLDAKSFIAGVNAKPKSYNESIFQRKP